MFKYFNRLFIVSPYTFAFENINKIEMQLLITVRRKCVLKNSIQLL